MNNIKRIEKLEKQLAEICKEIYELSMNGRRFTPMCPYVLVRVLPKEHRTEGGIWLADTAQTKTVYEGLVLEVWKPYVEEQEVVKTNVNNNERYTETKYIQRYCAVEIGDRVAFPHSEGLPVGDWLDDRYYRLVREGREIHDYHRVLGKLNYTGDVELQAKIRELTQQFASVTTSGVALSKGVDVNMPYGTN